MTLKRKKILLVLEDTNLVQTYAGLMGKIFSAFYIFWLNVRIIFLLFLYKKNNFIIISSETINKNIISNYTHWFYSSKFAKINFGKYRKQSQSILKDFLQKIAQFSEKKGITGLNPFELWHTQSGIYLSYRFFPYFEIINQAINEFKPLEIWILGRSKEEKIAQILAKKRNVPCKNFYFLDLSWFNNLLAKFLFARQIKNKKKQFCNKAGSLIKKDLILLKNSYIFSADFFRHLKILVPLYKKFKEKDKKAIIVFDVSKTKKKMENLYNIKEDSIYLAGLLKQEEVSKNNNLLSKEYADFWKKIKKALYFSSNKESIMAIKVLSDYFEVVIREIMPLAEIYLQSADRLLAKIKPKGIICVNDTRFMENALLAVAKKYKTVSAISYAGCFLSGEKLCRYQADFFFAIGNCVKDELLEINYPKEKIFVVGDPQFDFISKKNFFNKDKTYKKLLINKNQKMVLLISDRINPLLSYEEKRKQFINVSKVLKDLSNIQLLIKPHPTEDRHSLIKDIRSWGITNAIVTDNKKIELFELLDAVSVVIIAWSMVGFEAMLFKVPVIVANFSDKNYDFHIPFVKGGGAVKANDIKTLKEYIRVFANKENKITKEQIKNGLKFCGRYYCLPLGDASERIYKLINKNN